MSTWLSLLASSVTVSTIESSATTPNATHALFGRSHLLDRYPDLVSCDRVARENFQLRALWVTDDGLHAAITVDL